MQEAFVVVESGKAGAVVDVFKSNATFDCIVYRFFYGMHWC
ncbi:MAG: hypothetical protein ACI81F_000838, partial [Thalassolituus oleivorans]